jgi:anaerobic selenocysteine-containing dehydrogenase
VIDAALRAGPYGSGIRPWKAGLTLKRLRAAEHGIDLGPMQPCLPDRLPDRAQRRIDLAPQELVADMLRLRSSLRPAPPQLVLIGRREARTVNSWSHNLPHLMSGPDRCVLHMHPADAESRAIGPDDWVRISSRVGAVEVPVRLTDSVAAGVVALPHGYGHRGEGIQLRVAAQHAGASINDLTDPATIDPLSGNAVLSGIPVSVERCARG